MDMSEEIVGGPGAEMEAAGAVPVDLAVPLEFDSSEIFGTRMSGADADRERNSEEQDRK